jgi:group II intron reverse transcriptase/maturase
MEQTSLRGIANKAALDKTYRFRNLFGLLTASFLFSCWDYINRKASAGVDHIDAIKYEEDLAGNIKELAKQVKDGTYRAKLVLRKYIPKGSGKWRPLGIPAIADKLLQTAVAKILEAIYEQDFLSCSYSYRPKLSVHHAVRDLTQALTKGRFHFLVEADIKGFFNHLDHDLLMEMLELRIDDKPFLNLIRKWLKAGILYKGQVTCPLTGVPQGGTVSPLLANIYLHHVLDVWFYDTVQTHCKGQVYLSRYADDFVCAFELKKDASRFYKALKKRLGRFNLEVAEDKTNQLVFSRWQMDDSDSFHFLGFEFSWMLSRKNKNRCRKAFIQRRTSGKKMSASLANFKGWLKKFCWLPKEILFAKLNRKLRGYYNHYGIRGNYKRLNSFLYHITQALFKWLNRRSQRKSYNWKGFKALIKDFGIAQPRICHTF